MEILPGKTLENSAGQGKMATLETLKPFLHPINTEKLPSYEQVADQLEVGVGAVKMLIHRLRKRYTTLLRAEVARTVSDPGEIDGIRCANYMAGRVTGFSG